MIHVEKNRSQINLFWRREGMDRFVVKSKRPGGAPKKEEEVGNGGEASGDGSLDWPSPPKMASKKRKSNELEFEHRHKAEDKGEGEREGGGAKEREVKKPKKAAAGMRRPAGKHQTSEVTLEKHDNLNQKLTTILAGT
jgi:hypothetical protein